MNTSLTRFAAWSAVLLVTTGAAFAQQPELRYSLKQGDSFVFRAEVRAEGGDQTTILSGYPEVRVQSVDAKGTKLLIPNPSLLERTERKPGARPGIRIPRFPSMRMPRGPVFNGHEVTLDERGRVVNERGGSQISYMLGDIAGLLFEPLPEKPEATWSRTEKQIISVIDRSRPTAPFREPAEKERLNAEETTKFTIQESNADQVKIKREHSLTTIEKADGGPKLELSLAGVITLDRKTGVPLHVAYEGQIISREDKETVKVPLQVRFDRLSEAELKKVREEQAAAVAAAKEAGEKRAAERKVPLTAEQRQEILVGLTATDKFKVQAALRKLGEKEPPAPDKEVASVLAALLSSDDVFTRQGAASALETWATPAEVGTLIKALSDKHFTVGQSAMKALARLGDPKAIPELLARVKELRNRNAASQALKTMGAKVEQGVISLRADKEWTVRLEAVNILKEIGGKPALEALKPIAAADENGSVKFTAGNAIKEIEKRAGTN